VGGIKPTRGHVERPTQDPHGIPGLLRRDPPKHYGVSRAKKAVAFFEDVALHAQLLILATQALELASLVFDQRGGRLRPPRVHPVAERGGRHAQIPM
jgi:hypothetical protein